MYLCYEERNVQEIWSLSWLYKEINNDQSAVAITDQADVDRKVQLDIDSDT